MSRYAHEPFAHRVIVQLSATCPLRCAHCIVDAGPQRRGGLDQDQLERTLAALAAGPTRRVVFTGGEPFAHRELLWWAIARAEALGLAVEIVTSAHWAGSEQAAGRLLDRLPAPVGLSFSVSRHHLRFQPLDRLRFAVRAALARGLAVGIFVTLDTDPDPLPDHLREAIGADAERVEWVAQPVHLAGRAAREPSIQAGVPVVDAAALEVAPCPLPAAPVLLPDGAVMACCGDVVSDPESWSPLRLGHVDAPGGVTAALAAADRDPLVQGLRLLGPVGLLRLAERRTGAALLTGPVARDNPCAACRVATHSGAVRDAVDALARSGELALLRLTQLGELSP